MLNSFTITNTTSSISVNYLNASIFFPWWFKIYFGSHALKHGDIEVTSASRNEVEVKNDKSEIEWLIFHYYLYMSNYFYHYFISH